MLTHKGTQILHSSRLILRPFVLEDAEAMHRNWASNPEVTKYLTWSPHSNVAVTRNILNSWIPEYQKPDYYHWTIILKENGPDPIGSICVVDHDDSIAMSHIGYCLGKEWWHRGIMSEALKTVMDFLFDEVGIQRIESRHDPNNPHSGAVMRKCGMHLEAITRKSDRNNQGIVDACHYVLLKEERCKPALDQKTPLLLGEYDSAKNAVIDPDIIHKPVPGFPETVVSVFSHHLFAAVRDFLGGTVLAETHDVDGVWPVYEVTYKGKRFAFYKARLGAPACVGCFEDIIPFGAKRIILLGNCGVLDKEIQDCGIIIPTRAIRDEGTSYHYVPASDYLDVNRKYIPEFTEVLKEFGYPYVTGTTWTTDAFYRETPEKIKRRKEMGAICVEMECAAMQAMCDHRGVEFFQFLYAGDNLDHSNWDPRSLSGHSRLDDKQKIALLAFELACKIG